MVGTVPDEVVAEDEEPPSSICERVSLDRGDVVNDRSLLGNATGSWIGTDLAPGNTGGVDLPPEVAPSATGPVPMP